MTNDVLFAIIYMRIYTVCALAMACLCFVLMIRSIARRFGWKHALYRACECLTVAGLIGLLAFQIMTRTGGSLVFCGQVSFLWALFAADFWGLKVRNNE